MDKLIKIFSSKELIFLYIINLISSTAYCWFDHSLLSILSTISLPAVFAFLETIVIRIFTERLSKSILILVTIFTNVLIVLDYGALFTFGYPLIQDYTDIILNSSLKDGIEFFKTYFSLTSALLILSLICLNILIYRFSDYISRLYQAKWCMAIIFALGLGYGTYGAYNFAVYRNGMNIPQYTSITRIGYSCYIYNKRNEGINKLVNASPLVEAHCINEELHPSTIVFIIGESHCKHHSSIYGYEKETEPLLRQQSNDSTLYVFKDVVSVADHTLTALESMLYMKRNDSIAQIAPLLPMIFKSTGYETWLFDNQYQKGHYHDIMGSGILSDTLYNHRNEKLYALDEELIHNSATELRNRYAESLQYGFVLCRGLGFLPFIVQSDHSLTAQYS